MLLRTANNGFCFNGIDLVEIDVIFILFLEFLNETNYHGSSSLKQVVIENGDNWSSRNRGCEPKSAAGQLELSVFQLDREEEPSSFYFFLLFIFLFYQVLLASCDFIEKQDHH